MKYKIFIFFVLLHYITQDIVAQCTNCKEIYVWDFVTEDGTRDKFTSRMTRQFFNVLSKKKECSLIRRSPISKTFPEEGMLETLYFEDMPQGLQDTLQNHFGAKIVVFGILIDEGGSNRAISLTFQDISLTQKKTFFVNHEMYLTTSEIENPSQSKKLIAEALNEIICQEVIDPDFASLSKEEVNTQLKSIGGKLSKFSNIPKEKRNTAYYASIKKLSEDFQKCFNRFSQLQPSIKEVEKFNVVETEFAKQISNIGYDYLFNKLYEEESKYDKLGTAHKLGKLDIGELIQNREHCIELSQKLITHDLNKDNRIKQSKLETIKLNCYRDLLHLYNQQKGKETETQVIRDHIKELTPDLEKVLTRNEPLEVITNRVIKLHIRFRKGTSNFTPESYTEMERLSEIVKKYPKVKIELAGHTDNLGEKEVLHKLSKERAEAVKAFLVQKRKIAPNRIQTIGYGGDIAIANNATEETRKLNRRVEVTFKK